MYVIIGFIIMGLVLHPAGSTGLIVAGTNGVEGIGGLLEGGSATGGQKGTVTGVGSFS
jgi:hypothetical protein